jgi:hypothetical protein
MSEASRICVFCLTQESRGTPCSYGLHHEYPPVGNEKPKQPVRKVDTGLCQKCGLHRRNPASGANGCVHEYP